MRIAEFSSWLPRLSRPSSSCPSRQHQQPLPQQSPKYPLFAKMHRQHHHHSRQSIMLHKQPPGSLLDPEHQSISESPPPSSNNGMSCPNRPTLALLLIIKMLPHKSLQDPLQQAEPFRQFQPAHRQPRQHPLPPISGQDWVHACLSQETSLWQPRPVHILGLDKQHLLLAQFLIDLALPQRPDD